MRLGAFCLLLPMLAGGQGKPEAKPAKPPRTHSVTLGPMKRVPFVAADVSKEEKSDEAGTLRVRPLFVDTRQKDWTTGEIHEITERTFAVQRVMHVNDTLPDEHGMRWVWQPGPWMLVDRVTGRVSALHLPDFDAGVSDVVWYRDFAAYCGVHTAAKGGGLSVVVWQIGSRRPAVDRVVGRWPQVERVRPVCAPAKWQREPMRVTFSPKGGDTLSLDVVGSSTVLVEDGDDEDGN
ncbi:hypothetical protein GCM10022270_14060 [Terriglobus aquaticus]